MGPHEATLPGWAPSAPSRPRGPAALGPRFPARPAARLLLPSARAWAWGEGRGQGRGAAQAARPGGRREAHTAPARSARPAAPRSAAAP